MRATRALDGEAIEAPGVAAVLGTGDTPAAPESSTAERDARSTLPARTAASTRTAAPPSATKNESVRRARPGGGSQRSRGSTGRRSRSRRMISSMRSDNARPLPHPRQRLGDRRAHRSRPDAEELRRLGVRETEVVVGDDDRALALGEQ